MAELRALSGKPKRGTEQLARADKGFFAVVKSNPDIGAKPGIIFCLKQAATPKTKETRMTRIRLKGQPHAIRIFWFMSLRGRKRTENSIRIHAGAANSAHFSATSAAMKPNPCPKTSAPSV